MRYHSSFVSIFPMMICLFLIFTGTAVAVGSDLASQIDQEIRENPQLILREEQLKRAWDYKLGRGVPKDLPKAVAWMRKLAEQGYAPAQSDIGLMYERGTGVAENDQKAVYWYQKAAVQKDKYGMYNLARYLSHGLSISKDCNKAVQLYKEVGKAGLTSAHHNLGLLYFNGCGTVPQNYHLAFQLWMGAALKGHLSSQTNLGAAYYEGWGVSPDQEEAYYWSVIAAERGSKNGKKNRDRYRPYLSSAQIARAEKRAYAFLAKTTKKQSSTQNKQASKTTKQPKSPAAQSAPRRRWSKPIE